MRLMLAVAYLHAISIRNAAEVDVHDLKVAPFRFALMDCCRIVHLLFRDKLCAGRRELLSLILQDGYYHELCECWHQGGRRD
jgi:hypothetical protein